MRTRSFDVAEALDKAMALFWRKGFAGVSIEDLVIATGVSRYGLYGLYGDKRGLFIAALDRYRDQQVHFMLAALEQSDASLPQVREFFATVESFAGLPAASGGCLLCNSAMEFGVADDAIADRIGRHFERVETALRLALERAQARGEIDLNTDPCAIALYLSGIAQAAFVQLRSGASAAKIRAFLATALSVLSPATVAVPPPTPEKDVHP